PSAGRGRLAHRDRTQPGRDQNRRLDHRPRARRRRRGRTNSGRRNARRDCECGDVAYRKISARAFARMKIDPTFLEAYTYELSNPRKNTTSIAAGLVEDECAHRGRFAHD